MFRLALVISLTLSLTLTITLTLLSQNKGDKEWHQFKSTFNKQYKDQVEDNYRRKLWKENIDLIKKHNEAYDRGEKSYHLGENKFADMANEELLQTMSGFKDLDESNPTEDDTVINLFSDSSLTPPPSIDYRTLGFVTPVKDQGKCKCCWAFAATGALEAQWFMEYDDLVPLSAQNLVDCSQKYGNHGCDNGTILNAFIYIKANNGIAKDSNYPYTGKLGTCKYDPKYIGAKLRGWGRIRNGNETHLMIAVANYGPVAVAIDASLPTFRDYESGVYDDPSCNNKQSNHGMLIVGYGSNNVSPFQPYWLVKNSWGPKWGEQGYIRMSRNKNNQCGIANNVIIPLVP